MKAPIEKPNYINPYSFGPCYYYRLHNGNRALFRMNEIKSVTRNTSAGGGVVTTHGGYRFSVMSVFAEKVDKGEQHD